VFITKLNSIQELYIEVLKYLRLGDMNKKITKLYNVHLAGAFGRRSYK
jgi:hypothetical protein